MISKLIHSRFSLLFLGVAFLIGLGSMSVPLTGDQKVYLSVALEMKERSSFLIPFLFEQVNFLKPPFQYWMTLIGWKIFGLSLWGALIPSVLALVGSAYLVKRLSKAQNYLPSFAFAATLGTLTYGTTAQMEIWIVLFYLGAWALWLESRLFFTFLWVGVMAWVKGPLYPTLWVASLFMYSALTGEVKEKILKPKFIFALGLGVVTGLAWYAYASIHYQKEMLQVFFGRENFGKLQTPQGSPLGLWAEFSFSLFPLLFYFILGFSDSDFKSRWRENRLFWISFGLIPALFFTLFPYRVNTYLYLLTPLVVWAGSSELKKVPNYLRIGIGSLTALVSLFGSFLLIRLFLGQWIGIELLVPFLFCLWIWSYAHLRLNATVIVFSALLIINLIRLSAVEIGEWDLRGLRASATETSLFAYWIEPEHQDIWHEFGLVSSALGVDIARKKTSEEVLAFAAEGGAVILSDEQIIPPGLTCTPWTRLKRRMKFPFKELLASGLSIENPELHRTFQICQSIKRFDK